MIARTIATVALCAYLVVLALEAWRPGFVTYFWNPQILLIFAIGGATVGAWSGPRESRRWRTVAFFIPLVIVGALLVWQAFPPSGTRVVATLGTILLIAPAFLWKPASSAKS